MNELSDDAVQELQSLQVKAIALIDNDTDPSIAALMGHIPALCVTVRALREKYDSLKSKIAWHRDGVGPDVPVLQERYDKLIAERNRLCELADERHDLLSAEKRANDALRERLAQSRAESERLALQLKEWQEEKDTKAGYL